MTSIRIIQVIILVCLLTSSCHKDNSVPDISGNYCMNTAQVYSYSVEQIEPGVFKLNCNFSFSFQLSSDNSITVPEQQGTAKSRSAGGSEFEITYS